MAFKLVVFVAFVGAANAGLLPAAAPLSYAPAAPLSYAPAAHIAYAAAPVAKAVVTKTVDADFDPHPQYSYAYDVHDSLTGDAKSQQETRDGDVVQGSYSLLESDGTRRIVDYTADSVNGFNAVVRKEPAAVAVKAVAAAPIAHAPVTYAASAPVLAAPVAKIATPYAQAYYAAPAAKLAVAHAAPLAASYAAPYAVAHAAPVHVAHAAPIAYAAHPAPLAKFASAHALTYAAPTHYY